MGGGVVHEARGVVSAGSEWDGAGSVEDVTAAPGRGESGTE